MFTLFSSKNHKVNEKNKWISTWFKTWGKGRICTSKNDHWGKKSLSFSGICSPSPTISLIILCSAVLEYFYSKQRPGFMKYFGRSLLDGAPFLCQGLHAPAHLQCLMGLSQHGLQCTAMGCLWTAHLCTGLENPSIHQTYQTDLSWLWWEVRHIIHIQTSLFRL